MKRIVFLGCYGAFNCARVRIKELIEQYAAAGITGFKVFLSACGTQVPGSPIHAYIYDKAKKLFLMRDAIINPEFLDRLAEWAEEICVNAGMDFGIVFDNRYHQRRWMKNQAFKKNPFRDNDIGLDWGGPLGLKNWTGQAKPLFDSITFIPKPGGVQSVFHWKHWLDVDEKKLKFKFSDVGFPGKALSAYRQAVADTLVPIVKKGTGRLFIYGRNEERAGIEGDRSELNVFEKECFERAGVAVWGKRFHRVINRDTDIYLDRLHASIVGPYGGSAKTPQGKTVVGCLGALHEYHMKTNASRTQAISWGYGPKRISSMDGWDEKKEPFISGAKKLFATEDHIDLLIEESLLGNYDPIHEADKNLKRLAPIYKEITK